MKRRVTNRGTIATILLGALAFAAPASAGDSAAKCDGATCSGACAVAVDPAAQQQLGEIVDRQRDELVSLARTLAAERRYQNELEAKLADARATTAPAASQQVADASPNQAALEAENRRLRQLLDIEREENQKLAAKLRTASRIADLVFRSSGEEASASSPPAGAAPKSAPTARSEWSGPEED